MHRGAVGAAGFDGADEAHRGGDNFKSDIKVTHFAHRLTLLRMREMDSDEESDYDTDDDDEDDDEDDLNYNID